MSATGRRMRRTAPRPAAGTPAGRVSAGRPAVAVIDRRSPGGLTPAGRIALLAVVDVIRVPGTPSPNAVAVTMSPIGRQFFMPCRIPPVIDPSAIVVSGAVPVSAVMPPPPPASEKYLLRNIGDNVHACSGQNNDTGRSGKRNRWGRRNIDMNADLRQRQDGRSNEPGQ